MARTRRQKVHNRTSVVLPPIDSSRRTSGSLLVVGKRQFEDHIPDVLQASVSKTLSTRNGPLGLLAEKFLAPGPSATSVTLRKRPFCKRKWKRQFQELKTGDLRQSIWKFDKDEARKRRRQSKHQHLSVWEFQDGNGVGLLPGFAPRDYIAALAGRFADKSGNERHRMNDVSKFAVLPRIADAPSPASRPGTNYLRQENCNAISEDSTPSPSYLEAALRQGMVAPVSSPTLQQGLVAPVCSPAFAIDIRGKNKTLQPLVRSTGNVSPSSGHLLFDPWQAAERFDKRKLPPITELIKSSRSVSPSRPPSQRKHSCPTPVFDFNSHVQFAPTIHSGYSYLQISQTTSPTSRAEFMPLLPSVSGRSLKAVKATPHDSNKLNCNQEQSPMELQATSLTHLPKSLGSYSLLPHLQKPKNVDYMSSKGNRKGALTSHESTPFSGVLAPDNSVILDHVSGYQDMDPVPPSVSFIRNQGIKHGLTPVHQKLFRYFPMSRDDDCRFTDGGVFKLTEDEYSGHQQLEEDIDSGQQGTSDYESDTIRVDSPEYPTLAMVTFKIGSDGDLSLSPTAKQPMSITIKSKRAVRKLVREAITVSRQQQRMAQLQQTAKHSEQRDYDDNDLPDVPAPRAVIAVSRKEQRVERHQVSTTGKEPDEPVDSTQFHHNDDSSSKFVGFPSDVFDVPKDVIDASNDLGQYLDEAGFPPGSAVFVPPNGEPLVLTSDGGVVALPSKLALSGSEFAVNDVSVQGSVRDELDERDAHETEVMSTFEGVRGASSFYQHSTCSDSGVYESSQHILHNSGLAPIPSSPRTSARARNFQVNRATDASEDIVNADHQLSEHTKGNSVEAETAKGSCASPDARRNLESLIAEVSSHGVQDVVDQLKQKSKESSIERSKDEHIVTEEDKVTEEENVTEEEKVTEEKVTEEEKVKRWQAEFRERAMQQMEEEWAKYKQQKLEQEHQALLELEQDEKDKKEAAVRNQDEERMAANEVNLSEAENEKQPIGIIDGEKLSEEVPSSGDGSPDDGIVNTEAAANYPSGQKTTQKVVSSTKATDSDEENTSEIGERVESPASSLSSDKALGITDKDDERKQPTPEQVTWHAPEEPKKLKKKNASVKRQVLAPMKGKQKAKTSKSKRKSRSKSRLGNKDEIHKNNDIQEPMMEEAHEQIVSSPVGMKAPMQSAVSQLATQDRLRRIGAHAIDKVVRRSDEETSSSDEGDCKFHNVEEMDYSRGYSHQTGDVRSSHPTGDATSSVRQLLHVPHYDQLQAYIPLEDSEALDELSFLPSDVGTSAILTDGYDSETSNVERRLSRMEKRNLAAERRRQEVERKRQEQKEAKRRAAEEEARLEEMKRVVEEQFERQIAERRKQLQQQREEREQAEREAQESKEAELRQKDMMQRQMDEMKRRLQEELARRRQKEEEILQAKQLAAEAEAKRQRKLEERRLNWERKILEENDYQKRREMEEQRRREEDEARLLEEEERKRSAEEKERLQRQQEENARTVAQRKWYSKTMLEALRLMHEMRLNQEFTYSYYTFIPYSSLW